MSENTVSIYALLDPRDGSIRYIGKTEKSPERRLQCHISEGRHGQFRSHKIHWLRQLLSDGLEPALVVLETVSPDIWQERERFWIAFFRHAGYNLTNSTDGGEEQKGATPELRAKLSASLKGRPGSNKGKTFDAKWRESMSRARLGNSFKRGKKVSPEGRAKMSKAFKGRTPWNKGKSLSPEQRAEISAIQKGKKLSQEHRDKIAAGVSAAWEKKSKHDRRLSPEQRARLIALSKGRKARPETRAKLSAAVKAAWARRKAAASPSQLPLDL